MAIKILALDVLCLFLTPAILPKFKGSTLRGAFGHNLKRISCALRKQDCTECLLAESCAYALIFATEKLYGERISARPHPYIFNSPFAGKSEYSAGDAFEFNLVLIGEAVNFLPHIVYAIEEMGRNGIGRDNASGAGRFTLKTIMNQQKLLYSSEDKVVRRPEPMPELRIEPAESRNVSSITIDLTSPLRIKSDKTFLKNISFSTFIKATLRRISALERFYGDGEPDIDFKEVCRLAESVATTEENTSWRDYKRYSNRQKTSMFIGGVVGKIQYGGEIGVFLPYINYASEINLGKQTSFGLGHFNVTDIR